MAGLLDFLDTDEGRLGLGLLAAAGPRADGMGTGGRIQEAFAGADARKRAQAEAEWKKMQMEEARQQMAQRAQAQEQARVNQSAIRQQFSPMDAGAAMANGQGPTLANAQNLGKMPQFDPRTFFAKNPQADVSALKQAMELNSAMNPAKKLMTVAPGSFVLDEGDPTKPLFSAPDKADKPPTSVQEFNYGQTNPDFNAWMLRSKNASAPKMSVNLGDPTAVAKAAMGFQNDYRAATKDSYARAQAYEAMMEATKDPSAKGDLTMVYSFVKALDPASVVREGEISLVNANRSIPDQIKGYAQKLATGQNLLPAERQDLIRQAQTLTQTDYKRSRNDVKAYRDNAQRLGLDPDMYAPDPYATFRPKAADNPKAAQTFDSKPPAHQYKGKIATGPDGKRYQSDGLIWKEVQ